ncbi:MAG: hypothetical protein F4X95_00130 [Oligoflexia bacterium]|nr:hypothetical protein [Oligoflexia bacterium]
MSTVKYIVYFLLSCDVKQTLCFFNKYKIPLEENKSFPKSFIKYSRSFFIKNKDLPCSLKKGSFLAWRNFCKTQSYEEVLLVILYGILKYPKEKILWLLKVSPETLSWRLHQGLLALEKECLNMEKEKNRGESFKEGNKAKAYCDWLSQQVLPSEVSHIVTDFKSKKTKYLLFVLLCFILFVIVMGLSVFLFSFPSRTILYRSGIESLLSRGPICALRPLFPSYKEWY